MDNITGIVKQVHGDKYAAYNGDSCLVLKNIPTNSVDMMVFSPPFADLYTYSASSLDLGNSRNWDEFFSHCGY
jgi:hypothetical protein